jgi:hypothetical protein
VTQGKAAREDGGRREDRGARGMCDGGLGAGPYEGRNNASSGNGGLQNYEGFGVLGSALRRGTCMSLSRARLEITFAALRRSSGKSD